MTVAEVDGHRVACTAAARAIRRLAELSRADGTGGGRWATGLAGTGAGPSLAVEASCCRLLMRRASPRTVGWANRSTMASGTSKRDVSRRWARMRVSEVARGRRTRSSRRSGC